MSDNASFLLLLVVLVTLFQVWSIRRLHRSGWQFLAITPSHEAAGGSWKGQNYTWYGFFVSTACCFAVMITVVFLKAAAMNVFSIWILLTGILGISLPSSRILARIIEKKANTFTVGGASFLAILATPPLLFILGRTVSTFEIVATQLTLILAILGAAYSLGEGLGRLACISFGCCYGKPLAVIPPVLRRFFEPIAIRFSENTRKAIYAGNLDGIRVIPIQAISSLVLTSIGFGTLTLCLSGFMIPAFMLAMVGSQMWRFFSEFFRADHRGDGTWSPYQIMSLGAAIYCSLLSLILPVSPPLTFDLGAALKSIWTPAMIIFFQIMWVLMFIRMGKSSVTSSTITFHVVNAAI